MKRLIFVAILAASTYISALGQTIKTEDLYIRDPFILTDEAHGLYYLYRSADSDVLNAEGMPMGGVEVFKSRDLRTWEGPIKVLTMSKDNWITGNIWAPEVHKYKGKYYLFATINTNLDWKRIGEFGMPFTFRGTQVFWANSPEGPFKAFGQEPATPMDQMCLDGTLWVEEGKPYMVYCHEWVEVGDGEMILQPLKKDLSAPEGQSLRLFCASAAPWVMQDYRYITDGPFIYKTKTGKLLMIWSSFTDDGAYAIGIAESTTGRIAGPWKHQPKPLFSRDGGHGMIFKSFDGKLYVSLHSPNSGGLERAHFYEIEDLGDTLVLKQ